MNDQPVPAVSVIICTRGSTPRLHRAIDSVLAQDFRDFEVILVDRSADSPAELSPRNREFVRVIRSPNATAGASRRAGLFAASGEFTAYCDDDGTWEPHHLTTLVTYLREHPDVDLVYGDSVRERDGMSAEVAFSIDYEGTLLAECQYIFAGDVVHRTQAARLAGGFDPSLTLHDDWDLWLRMSLRGRLRHRAAVVGSRSWEDGSTSDTDEACQNWERVYHAHQARLSALGPSARHGLISVPSTPDRFAGQAWTPASRRLSWYSLLRPNEGHGSVGRQLLLALERQGVEINMAPTNDQPPRGFERFFGRSDRANRLGFYYHYWVEPSVLPCEQIINYSMWESTQVPREHVEEINRSVALQYVPCSQNLESFRESGVVVPIKVLHHGVDPARFPFLNRSRREFFTFGTFGDFSVRKGIDVLIRAFRDEFAPDEPARLLLKSTSAAPEYALLDPRITLAWGFLDQGALLDFLRTMDAFVLPSRGEGFGLCGLEAMATGLPLIATAWSGPAEYVDPKYTYPLQYRLVEAGGVESNHVRYHGLWAEPDYEHLRHLMRSLFEHPDEAAERGKIAAEAVRARWNWDRLAAQMRRDLDAVAQA
jgi:glycosyltransferase involved in cell wall biosynthesis